MHLFVRRVPVDVREDSLPDLWGDGPERVAPAAGGRPVGDLAGGAVLAVGAALVVWAYRKAPTAGIHSYDPIFWAGMVLAYLAVAWRALAGRHSVGWLGLLGLFAVLPKFLMSPGGPIYFDETAHFALLRNILSAGHLFQSTPLLPIGHFYPGMESVAATIHWLTGLSPWDSALTLIAVVHCLLPVQVYYLARAMPVAHRWAVVAGLVYATNPSFVYEDVQFAYESVAILLMLTIVRLYTQALAAERSGGRTWGQSLSTALLIAVMSFGCVATHHLTSLTGTVLLLLGALLLKPMAGLADHRGGWRRLFVRWTPVLALGGCLALWIVFVAPETVPYLFPQVSRPTSHILHALTGAKGVVSGAKGAVTGAKGQGGQRTLFSHSTAPGYERAAAIAVPVLVSVALLFAGIRWLRNRRLRSNLLWSFVLIAVYLVSLPVTLLAEGAAGAHRTWASTFVGVSLLPAALVILFELDKRRPWLKYTTATAGAAALVVLLVGNITAGTPMDYRFPGPYTFDSDTLSVTPETLHFSGWVRDHLGPGAHVVTDRFTAKALTANAAAVTPLQVPGLPIAGIWYNPRPPLPSLMFAMQRQGDDYLAVDVRDARYTATDTPLFVAGEPATVPAQNITRLAQWPWLHLLYSSPDYRLYKIDFSSYYLWYSFHAEDR
jgi:hypothetical protein